MSVCKDHPIDDRDFYWMNYLKDKCPHCQLAALQAENERLREALIYLDEECEIIDFADKAKKMIRAALSSAGKEAP